MKRVPGIRLKGGITDEGKLLRGRRPRCICDDADGDTEIEDVDVDVDVAVAVDDGLVMVLL